MLVLRRISKKDAVLEFRTGNNAFDENTLDGTLGRYFDQDILGGGEYLTYLLFEMEEEGNALEFLALLRFKKASTDEYIQELRACGTFEDDIDKITKKINTSDLNLIYLSKIGVVEPCQGTNISQIMVNFFEYLIAKNRENVLIYVKVLRGIKKVIGPSYRLIGKGTDEKWGEYFLASRIIKHEPK